MAITEIEDRISGIIEKDDHSNFIYDFLGVYDIPKATITKLKKGINNLSKEDGEIYLKNKLYYKETAQNLMQTFTNVKAKVDELGTKPRYIFVTDGMGLKRLTLIKKTQQILELLKDLLNYMI